MTFYGLQRSPEELKLNTVHVVPAYPQSILSQIHILVSRVSLAKYTYFILNITVARSV